MKVTKQHYVSQNLHWEELLTSYLKSLKHDWPPHLTEPLGFHGRKSQDQVYTFCEANFSHTWSRDLTSSQDYETSWFPTVYWDHWTSIQWGSLARPIFERSRSKLVSALGKCQKLYICGFSQFFNLPKSVDIRPLFASIPVINLSKIPLLVEWLLEKGK